MNLSIKKKLLLSNLANLVFVALVGVIGYVAVQTLNGSMDAIQSNGAAIKNQLQADQAHDALRADVLAAFLASARQDPKEMQQVTQDTQEHMELLRSRIKALESGTTDPAILKAIAQVRPDIVAYLDACASIVPAALADAAAAQARFGAFTTAFRTLEKSMAELSELIEKDSAAAQEEGDAAAMASSRNMLIAAVLSGVLALAIGHVISRSITQPLDQAIVFAARIADGDLGTRLAQQAGDETEIGRLRLALQDMQDSLRKIVAEVRSGTDTIATGSAEIANGNLNLSARTEQQASSLEETAASMEQLTSTVKNNGDSARQANELVQAAAQVAVRGRQVVAQVVDTMAEINASSSKIVEIIGVIDGIAFQTNILALNAAVEAARAGDQGRGFAVVASEVRGLAQRSAAAAREIKTLIDASVERVGAGSRLVVQAGSTMDEVVSSVQQVSSMMGNIATAGLEQESGIEQINQAIGAMDGVTQQNAALVEQAAAVAASLQEQSAQLLRVVSVFRFER